MARSTQAAPQAALYLNGADDGSGNPANTDFTIAAPTAGTLSFDWNYSTAEPDSAYDVFGYLLNGAFTQLTLNGIANQSGTASFSVLTGDVFGFRQNTLDSQIGRASTTISNFNGPTAPASVPGPLPILGVGASFAYSRRLRRRINLAKSPVGTDTATADQL